MNKRKDTVTIAKYENSDKRPEKQQELLEIKTDLKNKPVEITPRKNYKT